MRETERRGGEREERWREKRGEKKLPGKRLLLDPFQEIDPRVHPLRRLFHFLLSFLTPEPGMRFVFRLGKQVGDFLWHLCPRALVDLAVYNYKKIPRKHR